MDAPPADRSGQLEPLITPETVPAPFSAALELTPTGEGEYLAELSHNWLVGAGKVSGGMMLAVLTKAALAGLAEHTGAEPLDPLAVSAEFVRAPEPGPARMRTEVLKTGRTASVVRAILSQYDRPALSATVSAGLLPTRPPVWSELPVLAAEPPPNAVQVARNERNAPSMTRSSNILLDPTNYRRADHREPLIRGWVRPVGEPPDVLFALFAGDALPPVIVNAGFPGWAPTVQLTALLRGRPVPGWLRLEVCSREIGGGWFDEEATVLDADGRLVCQTRQLGLAPER